MDFLQLAAGRYSIRSFSGRPLTEMTNKGPVLKDTHIEDLTSRFE